MNSTNIQTHNMYSHDKAMSLISKFLLLASITLFIYMPFHVFISRWLSLYTGGLGLWTVGKDILTLITVLVASVIFYKEKLYRSSFYRNVFIIGVLYIILHLSFLMSTSSIYDTRSVIAATLFNGRVVAYLFIGMVAGYSFKDRISIASIVKIVLLVSTATAVLGIIQYFLPSDFMANFGYSIERGVKPAFFIDDKLDFPRIMSTLRDPNSYGAYLIFPIVLSLGLLQKKRKIFSNKILLIIVAVLASALFLTFSRGAWIGAIIAIIAYWFSWLKNKQIFKNTKKPLLVAAVIVFFIAMFIVFVVDKNSYVFSNIILHSDEQTILEDPNELRIRLQSEAASSIIDKPIGHGPGTAGLIAIGNPNGGVLTENYFLQILYEIGILGFALFTTLLIYIYILLARGGYEKTILSRSLVASFWGYMFVALLIHLWSNEAVALQWWLIAGIVIGFKLSPKTKAIDK